METPKLQGRKYSKILVFWGVTLCSRVNRLYHLAGPRCCLQGCGVPAEDCTPQRPRHHEYLKCLDLLTLLHSVKSLWKPSILQEYTLREIIQCTAC